MTLSIEEADSAFHELSVAVRQLGLGWLLDQVEDNVALGKQVLVTESVARKLSKTEYDTVAVDGLRVPRGGTEAARRPPKPNQLTRTVPYTAQERLQLLARAIRNAVVGADALEREIVEFAARNHRGSAPVLFRPDERAQQTPAHEASRDRVTARGSPMIQLESLLKELLDAIDAS